MENNDKLMDVCYVEEILMKSLKCMATEGLESPNFSIEEFGDVVDMLKDCAEVKEKHLKAEYYKTITEAMKNPEEAMRVLNNPMMLRGMDDWHENFNSPAGYNHRHLNNGEFASKGEGHRTGYTESMPMNPNHVYSDADVRRMENDLHHGTAWKNYTMSRRHYTETGNESHRKQMEEHAMQHLMSFVETVKEMYNDATPELRKRMKEDLVKLVNEMAY